MNKTASEKLDLLWTQLNEKQDVVCQSFDLHEHFHNNLGGTYGHEGDEMPNRNRVKSVHQQGLVAKVKYVPNGDPTSYTGIFKGSDYAIIRLSDADLFVDGIQDSNGGTFRQTHTAPSIAIKFLRNRRPSANYLGMVGFDNQG